MGGYSFANLGPGIYQLRKVNQPGWTQNTANPGDIITVYGGKDEDSLLGGAGDDWLFGDEGNDTLIGDTGNDRFMLGQDLGSETILDFQYGLDSIGLMAGLSFSQLSIVAENNSTLIRVTGSGQLLATIRNVPATVITATDFAVL